MHPVYHTSPTPPTTPHRVLAIRHHVPQAVAKVLRSLVHRTQNRVEIALVPATRTDLAQRRVALSGAKPRNLRGHLRRKTLRRRDIHVAVQALHQQRILRTPRAALIRSPVIPRRTKQQIHTRPHNRVERTRHKLLPQRRLRELRHPAGGRIVPLPLKVVRLRVVFIHVIHPKVLIRKRHVVPAAAPVLDAFAIIHGIAHPIDVSRQQKLRSKLPDVAHYIPVRRPKILLRDTIKRRTTPIALRGNRLNAHIHLAPARHPVFFMGLHSLVVNPVTPKKRNLLLREPRLPRRASTIQSICSSVTGSSQLSKWLKSPSSRFVNHVCSITAGCGGSSNSTFSTSSSSNSCNFAVICSSNLCAINLGPKTFGPHLFDSSFFRAFWASFSKVAATASLARLAISGTSMSFPA